MVIVQFKQNLLNLLLSVVSFYLSSPHTSAMPLPRPQKEFIDEIAKKDLRKNQKKIVAIIDTGADTGHPWIRNHLWKNPGESGIDKNGNSKSSNGIDDDGNGFIDDIHGWNFLDDNNNLWDENGHGTHISGLISGEVLRPLLKKNYDDAIEIMVLKYYRDDADPESVMSASTKAIEYATKMGAHIINYSGGGTHMSFAEYIALLRADSQGKILVAAAGNEKRDLDQNGFYPASYILKNVLRVAALKDKDTLLEKSNFGASSVDLAAPGFKILSAAPRNSASVMSGTSQATAFVSALISRYWSQRPEMPGAEVRKNFLKKLQKSQGLKNQVRGEKVAIRQFE